MTTKQHSIAVDGATYETLRNVAHTRRSTMKKLIRELVEAAFGKIPAGGTKEETPPPISEHRILNYDPDWTEPPPRINEDLIPEQQDLPEHRILWGNTKE